MTQRASIAAAPITRAEWEELKQQNVELLALLRSTKTPRARQTLGELATDWLKRVSRVRPQHEQRHIGHMADLHQLREGELTKATIEAAFAKLDRARGGTLGPAMLNKLRSTGKLIIDDAIACGLWRYANPFAYVKCHRVPRASYSHVTPAELSRAFAVLAENRRRLAVVALFTGMRPGELKALQKQDVDLERGFITVRRSLGRNTTKTGRERLVPIPRGCASALRDALEASPSELVFPRPDGTRERDDLKLSRILRTAFKKAKVITGYVYTCRRCGKSSGEQALSVVDQACCGAKMWREPVAKRFRFYDLRHACATLAREAGADPLAVKLTLGHIPRDQTDSRYTHMTDARFRTEMGKLRLPKAS